MKKYNIPKSIIYALFFLLTAVSVEAWTDGQNATYVIGQSDFISGASGTTATTLKNPRDVALDPANGKLYVADRDNNRVLRYAYPITANQPTAELVFGQPDFVSGGAPAGAGRNTISSPYSITVDSQGRLWVASGDNRVVWFDNAHQITSNQPDADGVLGQPDFTSNTAGLTQNRMDSPMGIDIDITGTLYVSEANNNRVLRFDNAASKANGANADGVLGQPDFLTNTAALNQSVMSRPLGVRVFGTTLFVGDRSNGRVLRFDNAASKADGANADGVIGQADFTTNAGTITRNTLHAAGKMAIDGSGRLYITDGFLADRVMIFDNVLSKADGADADNVLGQPDFTSSGTGLAQNRFNMDSHGGGLALDSSTNTLLVTDDNNNRVMIFVDLITGPEFNLKVGTNYLPDASSVDFGSSPSEMTFVIENPGDTDLTLSGVPIIAITGTDADQFSVLTQPSSTVDPLGNTTFQIRFQPSSIGAKTATISILNNDADENTFSLTLTGNATSVATFTLTAQKDGTGTGTLTSLPGGINCGADCSESYDINTVVALTATPDTGSIFAGWSGGGCSGTGSCEVTVDQALTVTATFNEEPEINLTSENENLPSGSSIDFGASPSDKTFTIENLGIGDLSLNGTPLISIAGTNADQFSVLTQPASPVAASGSTFFTIRFQPDITGALTASISIASNDTDENPYVLTLTGNTDPDNDGIPYTDEGSGDSDSDGIPDYLDTDSDNDGISDADEGSGDTDDDGTPDYKDTESDGDGLDDDIENGAANNGDGNADGTADRLQSNVASLRTYDQSSYVTLESPAGTLLDGVMAADNPSTDDMPQNIELTHGLFDFTINILESGGSSQLILYLPADARPTSYIKYGPTPDNPEDHWYEFLYDGTTGAEIHENVITLHFVDGNRGDDVLTQDGMVIDIGGPVITSAPSPAPNVESSRYGGGGSGCFIHSTENTGGPARSIVVAVLVMILLAGGCLAFYAKRRAIIRMFLACLVMLLMISSLPTGAKADGSDSDTSGESHPFYISAGLGFSVIGETFNAEYQGTDYELTVDNSIYPLVRFGYFSSENLSWELGIRRDIYGGIMERPGNRGSDDFKGYTFLFGPAWHFDRYRFKALGHLRPSIHANLIYTLQDGDIGYPVNDFDPAFGGELGLGMEHMNIEFRLCWRYLEMERNNIYNGVNTDQTDRRLDLSGIFAEVSYRFDLPW